MNPQERPLVFRYLDYRAFLRDYYLEGKTRGLSYRSISKRAGVKSSNYFKLVIDDKRNLSDPMALRFGEAVNLEGSELDFFCDLVRFNQAKTASARAAAYERLNGFRMYRKVRRLESAQWEYHSKWYLPAIRELASRDDFVPEAHWIASRLCPSIKISEARHALSVLFTLGLLEKEDDGSVRVTDNLVSTGPETRNVHVVNYHHAMIDHARASLDRFPGKDRDISGLTLCLGENGIATLKERVGRFRRELLELSELEREPKRVFQVNFQVFPLSTEQ